jgi:hypothetical protein
MPPLRTVEKGTVVPSLGEIQVMGVAIAQTPNGRPHSQKGM